MPNQVNVTLTTDGTTPAANVAGLEWAFFDQITAGILAAPADKGVAASTNSLGVLGLVVNTTRTAGQTGFLVVSNSNGNPASDHLGFNGPVIVGAATGDAPVITSAPVIAANPPVGSPVAFTPGTYSGTQPISIARTWRVNGAVVSISPSYTPTESDIGLPITISEVGTNALGSTTANVSGPATVQAIGPDIRPRFGVFASLPTGFSTSNLAAVLAALSPIPGSTGGGRTGAFTIVTTGVTVYGWVAVLASASTSGILFTENGGVGGWGGAGSIGPVTTLPPTGPSGENLSSVTYTDANGTAWRFFRQESPGLCPSPGVSFTIS